MTGEAMHNILGIMSKLSDIFSVKFKVKTLQKLYISFQKKSGKINLEIFGF